MLSAIALHSIFVATFGVTSKRAQINGARYSFWALKLKKNCLYLCMFLISTVFVRVCPLSINRRSHNETLLKISPEKKIKVSLTRKENI